VKTSIACFLFLTFGFTSKRSKFGDFSTYMFYLFMHFGFNNGHGWGRMCHVIVCVKVCGMFEFVCECV
jgi:hypothetical protein